MMKEKALNMEMKRTLYDSTALTYTSETWSWNESQKSKMHAAKMTCLRCAYGVNRMDGESKVYMEGLVS